MNGYPNLYRVSCSSSASPSPRTHPSPAEPSGVPSTLPGPTQAIAVVQASTEPTRDPRRRPRPSSTPTAAPISAGGPEDALRLKSSTNNAPSQQPSNGRFGPYSRPLTEIKCDLCSSVFPVHKFSKEMQRRAKSKEKGTKQVKCTRCSSVQQLVRRCDDCGETKDRLEFGLAQGKGGRTICRTCQGRTNNENRVRLAKAAQDAERVNDDDFEDDNSSGSDSESGRPGQTGGNPYDDHSDDDE